MGGVSGTDPFSRGAGLTTDHTMRVTPAADSGAAKQSASEPDSHAIKTDTGTVFTLAAGEQGFVQNLGTDPLFIKYGAGASDTSFDFALGGGDAADDGKGDSVEILDRLGIVSVFSAGPRYVAWRRSL